MNSLWLGLVLLVAPVGATEPARGFSSLYKRVSSYLNGTTVKKAPRRAAVAAVRGGIPSDQGENLDDRLLDRARALREALKRPGASARDENALRPIYEALAASQYVQALSIMGAPESRDDAARALDAWAKEPRSPALPEGVVALLTGPASRIDDKELVKAGWGRHARLLAPKDAVSSAASGWTAGEDAAKLDETLKGLSDSWLTKKLEPEAEARAHVLAGQVYAALALADLKGRAPAAAAPAKLAADDASAAPEAAVAFDPKAVYAKASKSVVFIACTASEGTGEVGTGSVIDAARRYVLTNAHVVIQDSSQKPWPRVSVYFKPAKLTGDPQRDLSDGVVGKVVFYDRALDLAIVELPRLPAGAPALSFGHPDTVSVGDRVAAIGHPEQGGLWTLTTGVVSTMLADLGGVSGKDAFQTDASINRGNSGGPLLDSRGRLIGINTSMSRKAADGLAITSINFAVQASVAKRWLAAKGDSLAYATGGAAPVSAAVVAAARVPDPVPAPPAPAPAPAPAHVKTAPAKVMITESKPYSADAIIQAEISKMDEMGNEMHEEIMKRTGR